MRTTSLPLSFALCLAALLPAGVAEAYCRTSSCMGTTAEAHAAAVCVPATSTDCGVPLAWTQSCIAFSVQQSASTHFTLAQTEALLTTAFASWMNAACPGGGSPQILVVEGPPVACDLIQYNQTDGNANTIIYRDTTWPYDTGGGGVDTLALTTVTYALDTAAIYDADMEINTADNDFTVGDTDVDFDLLSILTHETGHFLGMAHSHDSSATMWPSYSEGSISLRDLSPDDIAGICSIYPPGGSICDCDPTPRHGFSAECAAQQTGVGTDLSQVCQGTTTTTTATSSTAGGSCSVTAVAGPGRGRSAAALAALSALAAVLLAARRKRRR